VLEEEHLITNASAVGDYFRSGLASINSDLPGRIKEIRGLGLMVGVELGGSYAKSILQELLSAGIVANAVGDTILRFVPPLVVTREDCDRVVEALRTALRAAAPIQG